MIGYGVYINFDIQNNVNQIIKEDSRNQGIEGVPPAFPCFLYPLFLGKFLFYTSPFIEDISINSYNNIKFRNINSPK